MKLIIRTNNIIEIIGPGESVRRGWRPHAHAETAIPLDSYRGMDLVGRVCEEVRGKLGITGMYEIIARHASPTGNAILEVTKGGPRAGIVDQMIYRFHQVKGVLRR